MGGGEGWWVEEWVGFLQIKVGRVRWVDWSYNLRAMHHITIDSLAATPLVSSLSSDRFSNNRLPNAFFLDKASAHQPKPQRRVA